MKVKVRFKVNNEHYKQEIYWLAPGDGVTRKKEEAFVYDLSNDRMKSHLEVCACKKEATLIYVWDT